MARPKAVGRRRYAWRERRAWSDFKAFLRAHGGAAGCAREFAAVQPRPPHGHAALGDAGGVPRVPLYADKKVLTADGNWGQQFLRRQPTAY